MSETLGDLVDRLCTTNTKLFMTQNDVYRFQKMTRDEYSKVPPDEAKAVWDKLALLNLERNRLMSQVDSCFAEAIRTGQARIDARVKIT